MPSQQKQTRFLKPFFEARGLEVNEVLAELLLECGSYNAVARALKERYDITISTTSIRYYAIKLGLRWTMVQSDWFAAHAQEMKDLVLSSI